MDILWNVLEIVANILIIIYILKNWKKQFQGSFIIKKDTRTIDQSIYERPCK